MRTKLLILLLLTLAFNLYSLEVGVHKIAPGVTIRVETGTVAKIARYDTSIVAVKTFFRTKKVLKFDIKIQMIGGRLISKVKKNKQSTFQISTPSAVCGVRGTEWETEHMSGKTDIRVIEGIVEAWNVKYPNRKVQIRKGRITTVAGDRPPTEPAPMTQRDKERLKHLLGNMKVVQTRSRLWKELKVTPTIDIETLEEVNPESKQVRGSVKVKIE